MHVRSSEDTKLSVLFECEWWWALHGGPAACRPKSFWMLHITHQWDQLHLTVTKWGQAAGWKNKLNVWILGGWPKKRQVTESRVILFEGRMILNPCLHMLLIQHFNSTSFWGLASNMNFEHRILQLEVKDGLVLVFYIIFQSWLIIGGSKNISWNDRLAEAPCLLIQMCSVKRSVSYVHCSWCVYVHNGKCRKPSIL